MGRKVRCKITGEYGDSTEFYKAGSGYYKSKEIYEKNERQCKAKSEAQKIIAELLEYGEGQRLSPYTLKKYKELSFYTDEVILETFKKEKNNIKYYAARKQFNTEQQKVAYIFAVIQNHIADVDKIYKKKKAEQRRADSQIKFAENMVENLNYEPQHIQQTTRNIGGFIAEEER